MPRLFERTDTQIVQAVRHALEWDVAVPDTQIRSTVADGCVNLEGEVGTWYQRDAAERTVRHLVGVRGVVNSIEVNMPYVRTDVIQDDVCDGTVKLTGAVYSRLGREAVLGAAPGTSGVGNVEDHLTVERSGA